jgi:diguanylate cyclase (GGDEF)-like protein
LSLQSHAIKLTIILGILIVLILSFSAAAWYIFTVSEKKLYDEFESERTELTSKIAEAMADPIYYLSPNNGSLVLSLIKQDARIVSLEVYDNFNEMEFINIYIPERANGGLFENKNEIMRNDEKIGEVNIIFNDRRLRKEILTKEELIIKVFGFTFFIITIIMLHLLYLNIFKPLNRLITQANSFQRNRLEKRYIWKGDSEISVVGQSFEIARISILKLIDELKASNKQLEKIAITDNLTGLFNRHKLDEILEKEKSRFQRYGNQFCIILLDIDHFKQVNDNYGHQVGDEILTSFSNILLQNTRQNDVIARWGGEEFLIVCPETNLDDTFQLAEKLRITIQDHEFSIAKSQTASFGIADLKISESVSDLISKADQALYKAKNEGRNKVISP